MPVALAGVVFATRTHPEHVEVVMSRTIRFLSAAAAVIAASAFAPSQAEALCADVGGGIVICTVCGSSSCCTTLFYGCCEPVVITCT